MFLDGIHHYAFEDQVIAILNAPHKSLKTCEFSRLKSTVFIRCKKKKAYREIIEHQLDDIAIMVNIPSVSSRDEL